VKARPVALVLLGLIVLAALASLLAPVEAQPAGKVWRIGAVLTDRVTEGRLVEGLKELGYVESRNLAIDRRYAEGSRDQLSRLAAELVGLKPDVILVNTGTNAAVVHQMTTIPIVAIGGDLLGQGLVASLANPGGNITGVQVLQPELDGKRLTVLKEAIPSLSLVGLLFGTGVQQITDSISHDTLSAARTPRAHGPRSG
jgi:putative ABC transport system substrate-binding protein